MTIEELLRLKEKEDKVEYKEAKNTYSFEGGKTTDYRKRRKCVIGYIVALANEGGGKLIFGVKETSQKNIVVGTNFRKGEEGGLEQEIYNKLKIRVKVESLFNDQGKRVLVFNIPSRPVGKVFTFEDIPLMRVGDRLERMSDKVYFDALQEQEPDFSALPCNGLTMGELSQLALDKMKKAYSRKQKNENFLTLPNKQILIDLDLLENNKLNYAALILLGKPESVKKYLPQANLCLEYRSKFGQIVFDKREIFTGGYFVENYLLWNAIDGRNGSFPVQEGSYIFDIPYFNQEVIREAINNAVAHRDYRLNSEIVIRQYPSTLEITNPGGFPKGVTLSNLLTTNSTPRNRRLAEVLSKTGMVERSGQGIDKIYYQCLSEAKGRPDYSKSDNYQVELHLPGLVKDKAFALFINKIQQEKTNEDRLSVLEILELEKIRCGEDKKKLEKEVVQKLVSKGYVEKIGRTSSLRYRLSREYFEFVNKKGEYTADSPLNDTQVGLLISKHLDDFGEAKMRDFIQLLGKFYSKEQVKYLIYKFADAGLLKRIGKGSGTKYKLTKGFMKNQKIVARALELGVEKMIETGEINMED